MIVQLDNQQRVLLDFILAHPDTPLTAVYIGIGVGIWKGNQLRDSLKAQGLITDVEVNLSSTGAGRPTKVLIPTFPAFELLGVEPPTGRGGAVHRHMQHLVEAGARPKGYSTQLEKEIGNDAIVDVHLEKEGVRIAVEIAVVSKPEREIVHIKQCLAFGYDQVYAIFVDENLLEQTGQAIHQGFSAEEVGKVRLLPLSKLAHVG
jgi:hypothetical protein